MFFVCWLAFFVLRFTKVKRGIEVLRITKALNNNMVLARDADGKDCICAGKGIGFGKRRGDRIDENQIERRFVLENESEKKHYMQLFSEIPEVYWHIAIETADYARTMMQLNFSDTVILPLTDHIAGAVERYRQGVVLSNPLLYDIERIYNREFTVGLYALSLVKSKTGIEMTDSEAAFIAWHFINAGLADKTDVTANESVKLISSILQIVEESFQTKLDTEDWNYQRFLTHLKFFAVRLLTHATYEDSGDEELLADLRKKCRPVAICVDRVADFILINYHHEISTDEKLYLHLHIEKVTRKIRKQNRQ